MAGHERSVGRTVTDHRQSSRHPRAYSASSRLIAARTKAAAPRVAQTITPLARKGSQHIFAARLTGQWRSALHAHA